MPRVHALNARTTLASVVFLCTFGACDACTYMRSLYVHAKLVANYLGLPQARP